MAAAATKDYNGVLFTPEGRQTETIRAKSLDGAKAQMKKKYGAERNDNGTARWVCGLAPSK
jgi:hypothetical protein